MADLSIYSHLLRPVQSKSLADAHKEGMTMKQLAMQNEQTRKTMDAQDQDKRMDALIPVMEQIAQTKPEERALKYKMLGSQLVTQGVLQPNEVMEVFDNDAFENKWGVLKNSPKYMERQKAQLGNKYIQSQISENEAKSKKYEADALNESKKTGIEGASKLRSERSGLPTTKATQDISVAFNKIRGAAQNTSAAGDLALLYGFNKLLDPGSTIRESEFANAAAAGGVSDRVAGYVLQVSKGQRLSPAQRADFLNQANVLYKSQLSQQKKVDDDFRRLAEKHGLDPRDVLLNFEADELKESTPPPPGGGLTPQQESRRQELLRKARGE